MVIYYSLYDAIDVKFDAILVSDSKCINIIPFKITI